jgi:hypothetical protein
MAKNNKGISSNQRTLWDIGFNENTKLPSVDENGFNTEGIDDINIEDYTIHLYGTKADEI